MNSIQIVETMIQERPTKSLSRSAKEKSCRNAEEEEEQEQEEVEEEGNEKFFFPIF